MLTKQGQMPVEVLGVVIIATILLLFVTFSMQQKNAETQLISETRRNSIQCNAISETIANAYNNRATSEQILLIERDATIQKTGSAGAVFVGGNSCRYIGVVENEAAGISLTASTQYKFRKENSKVSICAMPC